MSLSRWPLPRPSTRSPEWTWPGSWASHRAAPSMYRWRRGRRTFGRSSGDDAPLARDRRTGETHRAHLGSAVETSSANGGDGAGWCAWPTAARRSRAPFLWPVGQHRARNPGLGDWQRFVPRSGERGPTVWESRPDVIVVLPRVAAVDPGRQQVTLPGDAPLVIGDVLRLTYASGTTQALATVASLRRSGRSLTVRVADVRVLRAWQGPVVEATRAALVTEGPERPLSAPVVSAAGDSGRVVLAFTGEPPGAGELLRITLPEGAQLVASVRRPVDGTVNADMSTKRSVPAAVDSRTDVS